MRSELERREKHKSEGFEIDFLNGCNEKYLKYFIMALNHIYLFIYLHFALSGSRKSLGFEGIKTVS